MNNLNNPDPQVIAKRLTKAKSGLTFDPNWSLLASVFLGVRTEITSDIPTAGTNGLVQYYNPEFVAALDPSQLKFLVLHEALHVMLKHVLPSRKDGKDKADYNKACDIVINQLLVDSGSFRDSTVAWVKETGIYDYDLFRQGDGNADKIYNLLRSNGPPSDPGNGPPSDPGNGPPSDPGNGPPSDPGSMQDDCTIPVAEGVSDGEVEIAIETSLARIRKADNFGKLPGAVQRLVGEMDNREALWANVLDDYLNRDLSGRDWSRANKRFASQGIHLPARISESVGTVVIALDTSGSIDKPTLARRSAEIWDVVDRYRPQRLVILNHDRKAYLVGDHEQDEVPDFSDLTGGGGTAFVDVLAMAGDYDPEVFIGLTDLYGRMPAEEPDFSVIWISTGAKTAPFGRVIEIND